MIYPAQKPPFPSRINPYHPLSQGLVACWLMNEGGGNRIYDLSGRSGVGLFTSGPLWSPQKSGEIISFPGAGSINTASTTLDFSTNKSFTFSIWMTPNFNSASNVGRAVINFTGPGPAYNRSYLRWENSSLGFYFDIADNTGGSAWKSGTNISFSTGTNHLLQFIHQSNNVGQFFFDGKNIITATNGTKAITSQNHPITIGFGSINSYYWNGLFSSVIIHNRALTAKEVWQLYQNQYCFIQESHQHQYLPYGVRAGGVPPWLFMRQPGGAF